MDEITQLLTRGVQTIYPSKKTLEQALKAGKKLRVYLGVDPTGDRLHIGHSIGLAKLQEFADRGHEAILLFGTGTVLVGDPSQRDSARKLITQEEIDENVKTWKKQVENIIDFKTVTIKQNAQWLLSLTLKDIIRIASHISAVQLFKRDMFQRRLERGDTVWFHETFYPLLQGYDSVAMDVDVEIGGTDQTFNMLIGRELQQKMNNREKFVVTTPMISGINGAQMSKTSGNCVWLNDPANTMYEKIMSIPDTLIDSYANLLTRLDHNTLKRASPMQQKKRLALAMVERYYRKKKAHKAQRYFEDVHQKQTFSKSIEPIQLPKHERTLSALTTMLIITPVNSISAAKRLIQQGGFSVNEKKITNPAENVTYEKDDIIRIGKKVVRRVEMRK